MHRQLVILISTNLQTCVFMNCKSFSCRDRFHCRWRNGNQVLAHRWPLCGLGELVCTESNTQPPSLYSFRNLPNVWDRSTRFANLSHPLLNCPSLSLSLSPFYSFVGTWHISRITFFITISITKASIYIYSHICFSSTAWARESRQPLKLTLLLGASSRRRLRTCRLGAPK